MSLRQPAVAGTFYPRDSGELKTLVEGYVVTGREQRLPKALVVPHAGYRYSGMLAGKAYGLVASMGGQIQRVVILGPNHTTALRGAVVPSNLRWRTPLGDVEIDQAEAHRLVKLGLVTVDDLPHLREHCLEVQLPFLQICFGRGIALLPLVVGEMSADEAAKLIHACWGASETLIVVSSDLSHFLDFEAAQKRDGETARAVLGKQPELLDRDSACGLNPLRGLLQVANELEMDTEMLGLCNSGDSAGDRSRVVGYGAFAFYEGDR